MAEVGPSPTILAANRPGNGNILCRGGSRQSLGDLGLSGKERTGGARKQGPNQPEQRKHADGLLWTLRRPGAPDPPRLQVLTVEDLEAYYMSDWGASYEVPVPSSQCTRLVPVTAGNACLRGHAHAWIGASNDAVDDLQVFPLAFDFRTATWETLFDEEGSCTILGQEPITRKLHSLALAPDGRSIIVAGGEMVPVPGTSGVPIPCHVTEQLTLIPASFKGLGNPSGLAKPADILEEMYSLAGQVRAAQTATVAELHSQPRPPPCAGARRQPLRCPGEDDRGGIPGREAFDRHCCCHRIAGLECPSRLFAETRLRPPGLCEGLARRRGLLQLVRHVPAQRGLQADVDWQHAGE